MSTAAPMIFTQNEATADQRTWAFHLTNTSGGTDATGKTLDGADVRISKAGGAFANAAGVVTEISAGWYKLVFATGDLDTIGALAVMVSESGCDTVRTVHQVSALDHNSPTVNPGDGGLTATKFANDALSLISAAYETITPTATLQANGTAAISMANALDCRVEITGTFGGGSAQIQTTEDASIASPVWTNRDTALTSNGEKTIAGPHAAIRVNLTGATTPALAVKFVQRRPIAGA